MAGKLQRALYEIAEDNYGYVTAAQAHEAGVSKRGLADLVRLGSMRRVARGVYRIVDFPASEYDSYFQATLWPQGLRGVLSHETALDLWGLCDVNPAKVHLTIPASHRVRRKIPDLYVLYSADLDPTDISVLEGITITTVPRTLRDCIETGTRSDLIRQAVERAVSQRTLTPQEASSLLLELP